MGLVVGTKNVVPTTRVSMQNTSTHYRTGLRSQSLIHSANVIGNVGKIRSNLCAVGKNSSHDTRTLKMNSKALNPTLPELVHRRLVLYPQFSHSYNIVTINIACDAV